MLFNARCLCTFYSFLLIGMGAIGGKIYPVIAMVAARCTWDMQPLAK